MADTDLARSLQGAAGTHSAGAPEDADARPDPSGAAASADAEHAEPGQPADAVAPAGAEAADVAGPTAVVDRAGSSAVMFGPYRIEELIGRGGMGEIHRAFDTVRKRHVALKRLPGGLAADPVFRARFRTEAALAAGLNEPHIIPVHDHGEIDDQLYLDMRLVEGPDLATLLRREGRLAPERAVAVVGQVADALDAAHATGLVHRDIKPGNVLVTRPAAAGTDAGDGSHRDFVYIADFGIARAVDGSRSASLTSTGTTMGSLDYVAPERFGTTHGDHRADIYALGCLLYESLTGERPFQVEGVPALINAHISTPPPAPSAARPELPPAFDAVIARAMAKDPDDRYPSAGALAAAARAALRGVPFEDPVATPTHLKMQDPYVPVAVGAGVGPVRAAKAAPVRPAAGAGRSRELIPPRRRRVLVVLAAVATVAVLVAAGVATQLVGRHTAGGSVVGDRQVAADPFAFHPASPPAPTSAPASPGPVRPAPVAAAPVVAAPAQQAPAVPQAPAVAQPPAVQQPVERAAAVQPAPAQPAPAIAQPAPPAQQEPPAPQQRPVRQVQPIVEGAPAAPPAQPAPAQPAPAQPAPAQPAPAQPAPANRRPPNRRRSPSRRRRPRPRRRQGRSRA